MDVENWLKNFPSLPLKAETAKPGPALDKVVGGWEKEMATSRPMKTLSQNGILKEYDLYFIPTNECDNSYLYKNI